MARRTVYIALVLILVGAYFLLAQFDPTMPDLSRVWPAFLLAGGAVALASYFSGQQRDSSIVFAGTLLVLMGLFFFLVTMGSEDPDYSVLLTLWPVFIIMVGISFLAYWLSQGRRDWEALFLALVGLVFGGGCLAANLGLLSARATHELGNLWPVLLILVGLILLVRITLGKRGAEKSQD
jgi:O-antigen/teichoic acid export membrane protein